MSARPVRHWRRLSAELPLMIAVVALVSALPWFMPGSAEAHQQKAAVTRVLFNANSGNLEVMHRFLVHDAEHAVQQLFDPAADILGSDTSREQFAAYVTERFALLDGNGSTLPLQYVGQEIDGSFLWVYQEMPLPKTLTTLSVVQNALRDVWPEQNNLVNIERNDTIQTLNFNGNIEWLSVSFD